MAYRRWWALTAVLWTGVAGCEGCLDLEDYTLVPPGFDVSGGGGAGAGSDGGGGEGGGADCTDTAGAFFVTLPVASSSGIGACDDPLVAGLRIYAFDPVDGGCVAWDSIETDPTTMLDADPRIVHRQDGVVHVAAGYASGGVTLPPSCGDGSDVVLADPSPQVGLFVARLEQDGGGFCTGWSRIATAPAAPLTVTAVEADAAGTVSVTGTLGGQMATFSSGVGADEAVGSAYLAHYRVDGALDALTSFTGGEGDGIRGIDAVSGDWLFAGALRDEDPVCQGCSGDSYVAAPASECGGAGGAGGAGGGTGGMGVGGGGTDNALNAMLWRWAGPADSCQALSTYGADGDALDAQVMFDVDARPSAGACVSHVGGLAGRTAWRLGAEPATALFDAGGATTDGFIARLRGASGACGPGGEVEWTMRLSPAAGTTWTNRLATRRCADGAAAVVLVDAPSAGPLVAHRCGTDGTCDSDTSIALAAGNRLVTLGLTSDGSVSWQGSFGPIVGGSQAILGAPVGRLHDNLAIDNRDQLAVVLEASADLELDNVDDSECLVLVAFPQAGRYLVGLDPEGASDGRARCTFALELP